MSESGTKSGIVLALAEEFLERYRQGERPSLREYVDRHPELAAEIREVFPAMALMENIALVNESEEESPQAHEALEAVPLQQLGDYRLIRPIGHGGMGIVYEAEQVSLGRHVALKVLPRKMLVDAKHRRRFEREARLAAKLHHTNIVPVFGVGEQDGLPYYVMQFIQGLGLDQVLEELKRQRAGGEPKNAAADPRISDREEVSAADVAHSLLTGRFDLAVANSNADPSSPEATVDRPAARAVEDSSAAPALGRPVEGLSDSSVVLPGQSGTSRQPMAKPPTYWQSVAQIGVQVAEALEYAHQQGVLHRDIKPSNLLLDRRTTVWVTDFGLAKAADSEDLTHTGDVLGTLRYMPPEAFEGQSNARSDIYSLGLTLYELLAFRPAFEEKERHKLIKQVTTTEPVRLERLNRGVPRDLVTVVHKAIDRDLRQRYASAGELAADLQRFSDDEPIRARPIGPAERLWRWSKRNPMVASLAAAVLGLLVLAAGVASLGYVQTSVAWRQEAKQRAAAEDAEAEAREAADKARRLQYAADMHLAAQVWESESGSATTVRDLLLEHVPKDGQEDLRDFAWRYQWNRLRNGVPTIRGHLGAVAVAFAPDGHLITLDGDHVLRHWDNASRRPIRTESLRHLGYIVRQALSPDGQTMAVALSDGRVHLIDLAIGRQTHSLQLLPPVSGLAFAPGGRMLAAVSGDLHARVWEVASGREVRRTPLANIPNNFDLALSRDGSALLLANYPEGNDITTLRVGSDPVLRKYILTPQGVAYSPDGRLEAFAYLGGEVFVWDVPAGKQRWKQNAHDTLATRLEFSPESGWLATGGADGLVIVWDVASGQPKFRGKAHTEAVTALVFAADGNTLASGSADGTAKLWDLNSAVGPLLLEESQGQGYEVAYSPNGQWLATGGQAGTCLWDARTRRAVRKLPVKRVGRLAFSPDSRRLATGGGKYLLQRTLATGGVDYVAQAKNELDFRVQLWDVGTGSKLAEFKGRPDGTVEQRTVGSLAFSSDGTLLVAGFGLPGWFAPDYDQVVKVWDLRSAQEVKNNLKQMGIAIHNHHDTYNRLPSCGWGWGWIGEPDRGTDRSQPGGWIYQLMAFMEQGNLQKLGAGMPRAQQLKINYQLCSTVIPMQTCPSRRSGGPFKNNWGTSYWNCDPDTPLFLARSDYASNAGWPVDPRTSQIPYADVAFDPNGPGPSSLVEGDKPIFWTQSPYNRRWTGVIYMRSQIRITDITNGTSNTYMLGEKYLNPTDYLTGNDTADNEHMYVGADNDICRVTLFPPLRDTRGYQDFSRFGSAHVGGCNMLYCDGRVEVVAYDVDPAVHQRAGDRR